MKDSILETAKDPAVVDYQAIFEPNVGLTEFRKQLVSHRVFAQCEQDILRRVASPGGASVLSVVGPTGVGKTQLLNEVATVLSKSPDPQPSPIANDAIQPYLPVVCVIAPTGLTFQSRFRGLLLEILKKVNPALADAGVVRVDQGSARRRRQSLSGASIAMLEELTRTGLRERRTRAVLIDEGQHLSLSANAQEWRMAAESLKLLGSVSGTLIVLFGTWELLCLPNLSGQLGRRTKAIHMRRYLWNVPEDRAVFEDVVKLIAQAWPAVLPERLLLDNLRLIYAGCVGCVGILFDWLHDAVGLAKGRAVTLDMLFETTFPEQRLRKFDSEARQCEDAFKREEGGLVRFAAELCAPTTGGNSSSTTSATIVQRFQGPAKARTRRGVHRNPTYDPYNPKQRPAPTAS